MLDAEALDRNSANWLVTEGFLKGTNVEYYYHQQKTYTRYVETADWRYDAAITPFETARGKLNHLLALNKPVADDSLFLMVNNDIYSNAASVGDMVQSVVWIFLLVGFGLAVMSGLFLFNYISISIADKKREIGILRAVGARGLDVFKIFFAESFIIAAVCTVLAVIGSIIACFVINGMLVWSALAIQLLNFTVLNALIVFAIALFVGFAATVLPVYFAAKKPPVESIRAL